MLDQAWIILALPLASFWLILFFGKRLPKKGAEIGIPALFISFVLSCVAVVQWIDRVNNAKGTEKAAGGFFGKMFSLKSGGEGANVVKPVIHGFTWWQNGGIKFEVGTRIDGLVVMMLFVVTLISLLVHIYSTAYMHGDRRFTYFFAALSLFSFSMLLLVMSSNLLQLLSGWELVGLCSFMLIGHWWEEQPNSNAALKAFLTTRTGDIGLLIGVIICFWMSGSFDISHINGYALGGGADHTLVMFAAVALMFGIMGKSGQFFLHTWLPDAMAGPTPVSALIHAATMVVAGVFLGARMYPVFFEGFHIGDGGVNFMALVGGVTIIVGALLAFVQRDIKKVLAYSTISQLGYMVMALGVGAWTGAVFHLFTHAFFKALLFLGAGSVSHGGTHHSFDMIDDMGGLRKKMPITFVTFVIGTLALAGIFPLAGFWSKDEILATAGHNGYGAFLVVGLIGAALTAAYMTRCVYLTFFGEYRGHHHPHESERAITTPLIILAGFSVVAGLLQAAPLGIEKFAEWVEPKFVFPELPVAKFNYGLAAGSLALAVGAIAFAAHYWFRRDSMKALKGLTERSGPAKAGYTLLANKYYLDALYEDRVVAGVKGPIANASYWVNQNVIDGAVKGAGITARKFGQFLYDVVDQGVVDGAVNGIAVETGAAGGQVRKVQSGRVQRYALILFAAVALLALAIYLINA